ncbi:MAG: hypothetical protein EXS35_05615 [Pedosphaera sp.]|nr:hypothetical protein [Pedosphaera sp.]
MKRIQICRHVASFGLILFLLAIHSALAKPRVPLPPWPETPLLRLDFDGNESPNPRQTDEFKLGFTDFAESWSGFALRRDGLALSPFVVPGVRADGRAAMNGERGCVRFWFSPAWSAASAGGTGPGVHARLLELVSAEGQSGTVLWSLYVSPDGATTFLSGQTGNGAADILKVEIPWVAGRWYCVALNYGPKGTQLLLNGELIAEGSAIPSFNPATAGLIVGSDGAANNFADGFFDEVTTFAKPLPAADFAFYFQGTSAQSALGPISAEEQAALDEARAKRRAEREAADSEGGGAMMRAASSGPSSVCVTNGRVYLTNIVAVLTTNVGTTVTFDILGGTNGIPYDIFSTTNLLGDNITNAQWTWEDVGYTCNTYTFTNQPTNLTFYVLGTPQDSDNDGLTDAYEQLVSKTKWNVWDTDGDGIPDGWEVHHGLNPLVNDASDDPDGDDVTNYQEYLANSNPHDVMVLAWGDNSAGQCNVPTDLRDVVAVAGGEIHSLALRANGTVVAWGGNTLGETNVPASVTNAMAIAANRFWPLAPNLALATNSTVAQWGTAVANPPTNLNDAVAIAAGLLNCFAVRSVGTVVAWGDTNDAAGRVPTNLTGVKMITAGWNHTVALRTNGAVVIWGHNFFGETNSPADLTNAVAISAFGLHTLALRNNGTVAVWGHNNSGQTNVPAGLSNVTAVAAGGMFSLALKADGTTTQWGGLSFTPDLNQIIGIGGGWNHALAIRKGRQTPVFMQPPTNMAAIAGATLTCNAKAAGLASVGYQWQFNSVNISGATNSTLTLSNVQTNHEGSYRLIACNGAGCMTSAPVTFTLITPPVITSLTQPQQLWVDQNGTLALNVGATAPAQWASPLRYRWTLNGTNSIALDSTNFTLIYADANNDGAYSVQVTNAAGSTNYSWRIGVLVPGTVAAWGDNSDGQLNHPLWLTNVISVAAGEFHSVVAREDGGVTQWGYEWAPVPSGLSNVVAVAAGYDYSLALRENGTVTAWGNPTNHATSVPTNLSGVKSIAAGWNHSVALRTNGSVTAWGLNFPLIGWTMTEVPPDLTNGVAISAGGLHSLAVRSDGTVVGWGYNDAGQTNIPAGLSNVVAVAAGGSHSLALKSDGTITGWGLNTFGQATPPAGLSNVMAIDAGWLHSAALKNDGTVIVWGRGDSGQTNIGSGLRNVKLLSAGGNHTLAGIFSSLSQYEVAVSKDLLLIYNTNSADSSNVCAYYLAHRPMVGEANVLGVGCTTNETTTASDFTNQIAAPLLSWLASNPTKRPQYIVAFLGVPTLVSEGSPNVGARIRLQYSGPPPFVNYISMRDTNACIAYINKLAYFGSNFCPGKVVISPSSGGYANTNYCVDGLGTFPPEWCRAVTNTLVLNGVSAVAITYVDGALLDVTNNHLLSATNVAAYFSYGTHSSLPRMFATNGLVRFHGQSGWYSMTCYESTGGVRDDPTFSNYLDWYAPNAFGGTNYENTPVIAAANTNECSCSPEPVPLLGLWSLGKNAAISSRKSGEFSFSNGDTVLAVGDPLVKR